MVTPNEHASYLPSFANSYKEAREYFLSLAESRELQTTSHLNPNALGIDEDPLYCDIACVNRSDQRKCLVISSGTHGVEGYCGSGLQSALLETGWLEPFYQDFSLVFVHALNPYGFSHARRITEDNVDLNRNFIDFANGYAVDKAYEAFRKEVFPQDWSCSDLSQIEDCIRRYIKRHGMGQFQALMTKGQYQRADDTYFGGHAPTWSRKVWEALCRELVAANDFIVHLDIHSGLGPSGEAEIIFGGLPRAQNIRCAKDWFGENVVRVPAHADSLSPEVSGPLATAIDAITERAVSLALEFGTVPIDTMLMRLIADNWRMHQQNCPEHQQQRVRQEMRDAFFVDDPNWKASIWRITRQRCLQVAEGLCNLRS